MVSNLFTLHTTAYNLCCLVYFPEHVYWYGVIAFVSLPTDL